MPLFDQKQSQIEIGILQIYPNLVKRPSKCKNNVILYSIATNIYVYFLAESTKKSMQSKQKYPLWYVIAFK